MAGGLILGVFSALPLEDKGPQGRRAVYSKLSSRGRVEEGFGGHFLGLHPWLMAHADPC